MPNLVVLLGVPASGKSVEAEWYEASLENRPVLVCPDTERERIAGSRADQSQNAEVFAHCHSVCRATLAEGRDVIFDATNVTPSARGNLLWIVESLRQDGIKIKSVLVVMRTPLQVCWERNNAREHVVPEAVMLKMAAQYVESLSQIGKESWDEIRNVFFTVS